MTLIRNEEDLKKQHTLFAQRLKLIECITRLSDEFNHIQSRTVFGNKPPSSLLERFEVLIQRFKKTDTGIGYSQDFSKPDCLRNLTFYLNKNSNDLESPDARQIKLTVKQAEFSVLVSQSVRHIADATLMAPYYHQGMTEKLCYQLIVYFYNALFDCWGWRHPL